MAITTAQQFIEIWTELDRAYGAVGVGPNFGDYEDATAIDATNMVTGSGDPITFTATLAEFPDFSFTLNDTDTTAGQVGLAVNLAFVWLGNAYVDWLNAGNDPILDIAKDRGGAPNPGQSYHDNLLGNLGTASATNSRFTIPFNNGVDVDVTGDSINDVVADPRSAAAATLAGDRPYFDGYAHHSAQKMASVEWDLTHGVNLDSAYLDAEDLGFETDTQGWFDYSGGTIVQEASGSNGVTSANGSSHARVDGGVSNGGAFTRFDSYRTDFGEGYSTSISIYLDTAMAAGEGFDYSVASNNQSNSHLRDFIFHVTKDTDTGDLLIGASNNSNFAPVENLEAGNHAVVGTSGWYTFKYFFFETADGSLAVAMVVYDDAGNAIFSEVRNDPADDVETLVGGNRYGWFTFVDVTGGIAIDDVSLTLSEPIGATFSGTTGDDVIEGTVFDDTFIASAGNDEIDGLAGSDTYDASVATGGVTVDLDDNPFSGTSAGDGFAISGATGVDGLTSIENVRGGSGNDVINGSAADNTFFASAGNDQYDGSTGNDTYDASDTTAGVNINLTAGTASGTEIGSDTFGNIENAEGGSGNDTITGSAGANILSGNEGDDTITGDAGIDTLLGGADNDTLNVEGDDIVDGGAGTDTVSINAASTAATVVFNDATGKWEVTAGSDTYEIENVEKLNFTDGKSFLLVGGGSEFDIAAAIAAANVAGGDSIHIASGSFTVGSQVVIDRDVNIVGQGMDDTQVNAGFDTGSSGDARGWFLVDAGIDVDVSDIEFNGAGNDIYQAFRHKGTGSFENVRFTDVQFPNYAGVAIAAFGGVGPVDVSNSEFSDIGRIGILYFGAGTTGTFSNNTYVGKGAVDGLDYAVEIGSGAVATVENNDISGNTSVASTDGSTSAGVLITTYFGAGSEGTLNGNNIHGNTASVAVGYDETDTSTVTFGKGGDANTLTDPVSITGDGTYNNTGQLSAVINYEGGAVGITFEGGSGSDDLAAGDGNDILTGGGGDDAIDGGAGIDTVVYSGNFADYTLTNGSFIISDDNAGDGDDGTDEVVNVEIAQFADATVRLVGSGSEYTTIQTAIDAADPGDIVLVQAGTYTENLTITKPITLLGQDTDSDGNPDTILTPASGHGIALSGDIDNGGTGLVKIDTFAVNGATGAGVNIASSTVLDTLEITNSSFANNATFGVGSGSGALGVDNVDINNSTFTDNGQGGANGSGDIILYNYHGNAAITDVEITSTKAFGDATASKGDTAIQISGFDPSTYDVTAPIGTVAITNLTTSGAYHKAQIMIQGFNDLDGLSFTNVDLDGNTEWGNLLFIDPIASTGQDAASNSGYPGNYTGPGGTTTLDLSSITINNTGSSTTDTFVRGSEASETITGTDGNDVLNALAEGDNDFGGNDVINAGAGNDILFGGDGTNTLNGGTGDDTYFVDGDDTVNEAAGEGADTVNASASFTLGAGSEVEVLNAITGAGNIDITGNEFAQTINGNEGDNTLEGGEGNDTIEGGAGFDTAVFDGNIADFDFANGSLKVTDTNTGDGDLGEDTLTGIEALTFNDANVLVVGAGSEFTTIQAAINAATGGETILVMEGTYNEQIDVNVSVTIQGVGNVVIEGPAKGTGRGVEVFADDVTLKNLTIQDFDHGISLDNGYGNFTADNITVTNNDVGLRTASTVQFDGVTITDSHFDGNDYGFYFAKDGNPARIQNVSVSDTTFLNNLNAAIYAETLETGSFTNIDASGSGTGSANGIVFDFWTGYQDAAFSNITFDGFTIDNSGGSPSTAAFRFAAPDLSSFSSPYGTPIGLSNIVLQNGTVDGTARLIQTNDASAITVTALTSLNVSDFDLVHTGNPTSDTIDGDIFASDSRDWLQGSRNYFEGSTPADNDVLNGLSGDDRLDGRDGDDTLDGGEGDDIVNGGAGDDDILYTVGEGTDTVDGGADNDTLTVDGTGAAAPVTYDLGSDGGTGFELDVDSTLAVAGSNVEDVDINLSGLGDTVNIGDLTGTGIATSTVTINGGAGNDSVVADTANPVNIAFDGGDGDDDFTGGAGDDTFTAGAGTNTFEGGTGTDTLILEGTLADYTTATGTGPGGFGPALIFTHDTTGDITYVALDVESITFEGGGPKLVMVGGETANTSIQAAIDAATTLAGDIIGVLPTLTPYQEDVTINKSVTILGSSFGVPANDGTGLAARGGETVLLNSTFTIAADNVVLDGLYFDIDQANETAIYVQNHTGLVVQNTAIQGDGSAGTRGIEFQPGFSGDINILGNYIDNVTSGVYVDGSGATISQNVISHNVAGIGSSNMSGATITNNYFEANSSEAIGADTLGAGNQINGNAFVTPGTSGFIKLDYTPGETDTSIANGNWFGTDLAATIDDLVSTNVLVANYLTDGTDTSADAGFQGNPTFLTATPVQNITQGTGHFSIGAALANASVSDELTVAAGDYSGESPLTVDVNDLTIDAVAGATGIAFQMGTATELALEGDADIDVTGDGDGETITGNDGDNVIKPGAGDDTVSGGLGTDTLDYSDQTSGVSVAFEFNAAFGGGIGSDIISGFENIRGGSGNDVLAGDAGNNTFFASQGDDDITGGAGTDTYDASDSTHAITALMSLNTVGGTGVGSDSINGVENIIGSDFNDNLNGDSNANVLEGNTGNDNISGAGGNDILRGGAGDDIINGGEGDDILNGNDDNDTLDGGIGEDRVFGADGNDTLNGGDDDDEVRGGRGVDIVNGDAGNDILYGGDDNDTIDGGTGFDTLVLNGNSADYTVVLNGDGSGTVTDNVSLEGTDTFSNIEFIRFDGDNVTIAAVPPADGDDDLDGAGGSDILFRVGGAGNGFTAFTGLNATIAAVGENVADTVVAIGGDIDGVGGDDIVFTRASNGSHYRVDADTGVTTNIGISTMDIRGVSDVDGDGGLDFVMYKSGVGFLRFDAATATYEGGYGRDGQVLAGIANLVEDPGTADDGQQELLFINNSTNAIYAVNGATGAYVGTIGVTTSVDVYGFADVNGDGTDEVIVRNLGNQSYRAVDSTGTTVIEYGRVDQTLEAIADVDGDGMDDLVFKMTNDRYSYISGDRAEKAAIPIDNLELVGVGNYDASQNGSEELLFREADGSYVAIDATTASVVVDYGHLGDGVLENDLFNSQIDLISTDDALLS